MNWLKRLFRKKVVIITHQTKKDHMARQKIRDVCDHLNRESGRPAKKWERMI